MTVVHALARLLVIAALLIAAALAWPQRAAAHAVLLGSDPAHRAVLATAPARITLSFNEPVMPIDIRVLDARGRAIELPRSAQAIDRDVRIDLPPGLGNGTYVVSYRVVSADGHPVGGALLFSVGPKPENLDAAAPGAGDDAWRWAAAANRALHVVCLFLAAGGLLFAVALAHRFRQPSPFRIPAALAAATALTGLYLHGALVTGGGDPLRLEFWAITFATPQARSTVAVLLGLAIAFPVTRRLSGSAARIVAIAGASISLAAAGITGHSAAAGPAWWPVAATHLVAAGFWFGSLPPLMRILSSPATSETVRLLQRFSLAAIAAVLLLAAAGFALALLRLDRLEDFADSGYGQLVLIKIAGLALLIVIAASNKLRLTPALAANRPEASRLLRRSIAIEIAFMTAIVGVAALLAHTDPHAGHARREHHEHHPGIALKLDAGERSAVVSVRPGALGRNTLAVSFARASETLQPLEVTLMLALPAAGVEPFTIALKPSSPGTYTADLHEIALPGRWHIRIDALISDFEKVVFRGEVEIK